MSANPTSAHSPGWFSTAASFLVGVFTRNLPAKLAALVLALLVWFTVRQDITANHTADQCRVISSLPPGLIWIDTPPEYVKVKFSGPRSRMSDILKDPEGTRISLRVQESDLVGQFYKQQGRHVGETAAGTWLSGMVTRGELFRTGRGPRGTAPR